MRNSDDGTVTRTSAADASVIPSERSRVVIPSERSESRDLHLSRDLARLTDPHQIRCADTARVEVAVRRLIWILAPLALSACDRVSARMVGAPARLVAGRADTVLVNSRHATRI